MATTLSTASRNAGADAIAALVNNGTTNPTGKIRFTTAGGAITLAELDFSAAAFGAAANGSAVANAISPDNAAAAAGTVAEAIILDRDNTVVLSGLTVGAIGSAADITFDKVAWDAGDKISLTSLTLTMPAA